MATTWMKPIHKSGGASIFKTITTRQRYALNPLKNEDGEHVRTYACHASCADEDFMLSKQEYEYVTGRSPGKRDILAYHIRQSFKPGEITPQEALDVGYETAMRFTKGRHAYIVSVHTDRKHIHCHVIFNSTALDGSHKFKNFWRSSFALRRLSDIICAEHGLSVVENPKPSKGKNYGEWLGNEKPPTKKATIIQKIDEILPDCATFDDFLSALRTAGFTVKTNRKHISVCAPGQKRPSRLDSLGEDYTESAIRARIGNVKVIASGGDGGTRTTDKERYLPTDETRVNLLVDIQEKLKQGKGQGYAHWAAHFNLQSAAKTLIFLKEQGIESYEDLVKKSSSASGDFAALTKRIKESELRQKNIAELQRHIGTYGKTRDIYAKYRASGWNRDFYDAHSADIILHRAAKKYFNELGVKKLPSINQLKQEYAALAADRKKLYGEYHALKDNSRKLSIARANAENLLGIVPPAPVIDASRENIRRDAHEI